jgi:hypothetical protein
MNFDDIISKLMPLFEKKMAFSQELASRAMSLEERKESNRTDIEYRKLENQLSTDKDKLKWEQEKTIAGFKNGLDLAALHNKGLVDVAVLNRSSALDVAKVNAEAHKYGYDTVAKTAEAAQAMTKRGQDTELFSKSLALAQGTKTKDVTGAEVITPGSAEARTVANTIGRDLGLMPAAGPSPATTVNNNPQEKARSSYNYIQALRNGAGGKEEADRALALMSPEMRKDVLALGNSDTAASQATTTSPIVPIQRTVAPVAPPPVVPPVPPVSPTGVAPLAPAAEVVRPVESLSTAAPAARPEKMTAAAGPLGGNGLTAFGEKPFGMVGEIFRRGALQAAQKIKQRDEEQQNRLGGTFSR